jgi:hypothetical protein
MLVLERLVLERTEVAAAQRFNQSTVQGIVQFREW